MTHSPERGPSEEEPQESKNIYIERLETKEQYATETQREVEKIQSAKYGEALLTLMERSGNNPEIINNLNEFLTALQHQSIFGASDKPLAPGRQKDITDFIGEAAKALRWTVGGGGRPSNIKVDLNKWELNK